MLLILCQTVEIGMASKNNICIHIYIYMYKRSIQCSVSSNLVFVAVFVVLRCIRNNTIFSIHWMNLLFQS